jgi:hypothetical protein
MNIDSGILEWQTHFMGIFWKYDYKKQLKDIRPFVFHSPSLTLWMPLLIEEIYIGLKLYVFIHCLNFLTTIKTIYLN